MQTALVKLNGDGSGGDGEGLPGSGDKGTVPSSRGGGGMRFKDRRDEQLHMDSCSRSSCFQ